MPTDLPFRSTECCRNQTRDWTNEFCFFVSLALLGGGEGEGGVEPDGSFLFRPIRSVTFPMLLLPSIDRCSFYIYVCVCVLRSLPSNQFFIAER